MQSKQPNGIAQSKEYISAIGKVDKRLLIILDLDILFNQAEMSAPRDAGKRAC